MNIGIAGNMGAGKTTIANLIAKEFGYEVVSFANGVREVKKMLFPNAHDRSILQSIGTKMREIDQNVWINYLISKLENGNKYVVDDVRYSNEVDSLLSLGWYIIKLEASPAVRIERLEKAGKPHDGFWHYSELEPFLINPTLYGNRVAFIDADRPLDEVWNQVREIVIHINK
jgi:dephospho-CoA kinase